MEEILLSELECPVCMEYMLSPISLCENGHNICKVCRPQLENCPTCRGTLTNTRCVTLEKLVNNLEYPCVYRKMGCPKLFSVKNVADHHAVCQFSPYNCPVNQCKWKGLSAELRVHVEEEHKDEVQLYNNDGLMVFNNYDEDICYKKIIRSPDHVFVASVSVRNSVWRFVLQCVGSRETAEDYEYTLTLSSTDNGCVKVTHVTHSIKENLENVYRASKCVKLPLEVIQEFITEDDDLLCYVTLESLTKIKAMDLNTVESDSDTDSCGNDSDL